MGNNFCSCGNANSDLNKKTVETNLVRFIFIQYSQSKFSNYYLNNEEESFRSQLNYREQRTKAGTLWDQLEGIEKIVVLYNVNLIIKHFRKYLKNKRQSNYISNQNNNNNLK